MKYTLLAFLAIAAIATFSATQTTKEYVDTKASNTLVTAKSYTDAKAVEVTALIPNTNDFLTSSWTNGLSVVAGQGASASGGVNTVIGSGAVAEGVGATAYGEMCRAIGQHAVAWGSARALGDYCVAMGLNAEAAAAYSLAIGKDSMAIQQYTFAAGTEAVASNYNAFVIGNLAKALGQDSMAVGNRAQAFDMKSTAMGFESVARGWNSSAIGSYSLAHGLSSLSAGAGAVAYGAYATALGMSACASNSSAVAIGYNSKALHSSSLSFGSNAKSAGYNSVAVGASTEANQQSVAIGSGAKATGNRSVAIGRDAKATHTSSVAIGPTAETTADSTIRIAYNPSDIILGFWQPKSLQAYFNELTPTIDWSIASNIVRNAEFLPSKYYYVYRGTTNMTAKWQWRALGYNGSYSTTINLLPANSDSLVSMDIGDGAMISFKNGGRLNVSNGGEMWVPDPNAITFGSGQNQTNFNDYVMSLAVSGISTEANARAAGDAALDAKIATKQTNLVSGVNIKTINGYSVLGSGNLDFSVMTPEDAKRIAANQVTNDVAQWAMAGNDKPQGMTTNAVKSLINAEVGGTNTLAHVGDKVAWSNLTNAPNFVERDANYAMVSNRAMIAVTNHQSLAEYAKESWVTEQGYAKTNAIPTAYLASATATANSITVTDNTNGVKTLSVNYEYALGSLAPNYMLSTGEIRNITASSDFNLNLILGYGATESADCALWVDASGAAADVSITDITGSYTIYGDTGYSTVTHGKRALITFTRITSNVVIAMKKEF